MKAVKLGAAILCMGLGLLPGGRATAASLTTLYDFPGGGDGVFPVASLLNLGGVLYGTTLYGGSAGRGAVFSINPTTGAETIVHSFGGDSDGAYPGASLIAVGGMLYGTTEDGGAANLGTVFKIDPSTGVETVLYAFTQASGTYTSAALLSVGGYLYGTAYGGGPSNAGTVFKINTKTGAETTVYAFTGGADGAEPSAALTNAGGVLYGTTYAGAAGSGTIFSINIKTGAEKTLIGFDYGQFAGPLGPLLNIGGTLYGTTSGGGPSVPGGTVFALSDPATPTLTTLYDFTNGNDGCEPAAGLLNVGGILYGTAAGCGASYYGTIFKLDPSTRQETTLYAFDANQGNSLSGVIGVSGILYGTTTGAGGPETSLGTVYKISPKGGATTTLHSFTGANPDYQANSALIDVGSTFYGTTANGGMSYAGSVFTVGAAGAAGATLYSFTGGADGGAPTGSLVNVSGTLYGAAEHGGASNAGVIFAINPSTGAETVLYNFTGGNDGAVPQGGLLYSGGSLFGTTQQGGAYSVGTIFKLNIASGRITTLYAFTGSTDGLYPVGGLSVYNGTLYGATQDGGADYSGNVFAFNTTAKTLTTLYSFTGGSDGGFPASGVVVKAGYLYGTTEYYGSPATGCYGIGCGTVYKINIATKQQTTLYAFSGGNDGGSPAAALIEVGGMLYGTTEAGGTAQEGTVFEINPGTGALTSLYAFTGNGDGSAPRSALLSVGKAFYGTTSFGGPANTGTVFSFTP